MRAAALNRRAVASPGARRVAVASPGARRTVVALLVVALLAGCDGGRDADAAFADDASAGDGAALDGGVAADDDAGAGSDAGADAAPDTGADAGDAPPPGTFEYRLAWDLAGVAPHAAGGWTATNDLGHVVHVERGWISSHAARLVLCEPAVETGLLRLLGVGTAWAGHSEDVPEPSATPVGRVEDVATPAPAVLGVVRVTDLHGPYCHVHYVVARALEDAVGLPSDERMVDVSVHLEGTVTRPGEAPVPFAVRTSYATGASDALRDGDTRLTVDPERETAVVTITRAPARFFDGVDLAADTERERVEGVLYAIAQATTFSVASAPASDAPPP